MVDSGNPSGVLGDSVQQSRTFTTTALLRPAGGRFAQGPEMFLLLFGAGLAALASGRYSLPAEGKMLQERHSLPFGALSHSAACLIGLLHKHVETSAAPPLV